MNYDTYSGIPLSVEVWEFLAENEKEWKRQKDRIYQYGVIRHAFDVEERSPGNPGGATCDPIYAVTRAQKLSAEKAFFRQEARKALNAALSELSASCRRRLVLHFYDELSYSEIARRENVSESAVRGADQSLSAAAPACADGTGDHSGGFRLPVGSRLAAGPDEKRPKSERSKTGSYKEFGRQTCRLNLFLTFFEKPPANPTVFSVYG